jgi:tubulin beta
MKVVRREAESCDNLQGFQVTHSLDGGTGSCLGAPIISRIKEDYANKIMCTYSITPSQTRPQHVLAPFNATMSIADLIVRADQTYFFENEALYDICSRTLNLTSPDHNDLNHLVALTMSGLTTYLRFPGELTEGLRKFSVEMVPFERLHFFLPGFAPLTSCHRQQDQALTVPELTEQIFDTRNMMAACDPRHGHYFAVATFFRGHLSANEVNQRMLDIRENIRFAEGCPNIVQTAFCEIPCGRLHTSATYIANTTAIQEVFRHISEQLTNPSWRRTALELYRSKGLMDSDFLQAESSMLELLNEYQGHE